MEEFEELFFHPQKKKTEDEKIGKWERKILNLLTCQQDLISDQFVGNSNDKNLFWQFE